MEGTFRPWHRAATEPFEGTPLVVAAPGHLGFFVAFCEQDDQRVTPLLLKNAVPLYEAPVAGETDRVSAGTWARIRDAVMLYNPGLVGCPDQFEDRHLRVERVWGVRRRSERVAGSCPRTRFSVALGWPLRARRTSRADLYGRLGGC